MRTTRNQKSIDAMQAAKTSCSKPCHQNDLNGLIDRLTHTSRACRGRAGVAALAILLTLTVQLISTTPAFTQGHHSARVTDDSSDEDLQSLRQQRQERRAEHAKLKDERLGLRAFRDVSYVPGSNNDAQKLDLCLPEESRVIATGKNVRAGKNANIAKPYPVVVFIHGGGWRNGSRRNRVFYPLVPRGYAVASISYRLTKEATWPAQIYDCKAAVRWIRAHAKEYNLDPERVGVWGESAGGHLAALLGTSGGVKELEGNLGNPGFSSSVQAVCDYFGPTDLVHLLDQQAKLAMPSGNPSVSSKNFIEWLLAGPLAQHLKEAREASPLTYVSTHSPPFFIVHGDRDTTVPLEQSKQLYEALRKDHVSADLKIIPGVEHGTSAFPPGVANDVIEFFDSKLKSLSH